MTKIGMMKLMELGDFVVRWEIGEHIDGLLIRDFLIEHASLSNRLIKKLKAHDGGILVDGVERTVRHILRCGEQLELVFPPEQISPSLEPVEMPLDIVYEDDFLLVVNKPAGMPVIPSQLHPTGTLANGILHYYLIKEIPYTIHVVTRLDKDTSGLVLIAKHDYSHSLFSNLQRKKEVRRKYIAIVEGILEEKKATIDLPIARRDDSIIERIVDKLGKEAVTYYQVLDESTDLSVVEVELETGRTHQIRVHFSHLGHPLVGDDLYGGRTDLLQRQGLHCSELHFIHPFTRESLSFKAPLPEDLAGLKGDEYRIIDK